MIKRILINIFLSFMVLPVIVPLLMYLIGITFGYNILEKKPWYSFGTYFQIHWGGIIGYGSFLILVFVFGIYNFIIVTYYKRNHTPVRLPLKFTIYFILLFILLFISGIGMFFDMGNSYYYLKLLLLLLLTSLIMVYMHYWLVDRKTEGIDIKEGRDQL